jgi:hypothetical protein
MRRAGILQSLPELKFQGIRRIPKNVRFPSMRRPGIEPGSSAWEAEILTT